MSTVISGNMVGGAAAPLKTVILEDEYGNQLTGVCVESVQLFDATPSDVKIGKTFVSDSGAQTGENTIIYRTYQSTRLIRPGKAYVIPLVEYNQYDYTKLQCIIATYSSDVSKRMAANKIVLNDNVYAVNSSDVLSTVTKDTQEKSINLNIINDTQDIHIMYYFTYKEEEE